MTRRELLAAPSLAAAQSRPARATRFQLAGMTITYSGFPFARALEGIRRAGFEYVAWGTTHEKKPILTPDEPAARARDIAAHCRGEGLEPVMMFSQVNLEAPDAAAAHVRRIAQAAAAKIPFLLTFGRTERGQYESAIQCLKHCGPIARDAGITVVVKQHGGNTATGKDILKILADVNEGSVRMCYDAGNVLDYESHDPIADIRECWREIRAFCIKDHRDWPKDQDCGPGFGEIDHYRLLEPVMNTGLAMPLAFENVFEPLVSRPATPEAVDALNRRAREYVQAVIGGLRAQR
jgi:sugar phosphate isomerase/epimerase